MPYEEPEPRTVLAVGTEIGQKSHALFPGGVLVDEKPWEHAGAVARTRRLMATQSTPAIFEAAFECDDVRVRVDVLERLPDTLALVKLHHSLHHLSQIT